MRTGWHPTAVFCQLALQLRHREENAGSKLWISRV
jgi:hypothetical protein